MKRKLLPVLILALFVVLASCAANPAATSTSPSETPSAAASAAETLAAVSSTPPETTEKVFVFTRENFPRMDGSTSTIPLGQAIASVLLGEPRDNVVDLAVFNKTSQSYRNLSKGLCDIVIAAEASESVYQELKDAGFKYEQSPIANDALVFIVNADNPVNSLTTEQVQKIYTGEITNWKQVGGDDLKIEAFQRNETSGSQTLMVKLVMNELKMTQPPEGYAIGEMEGLISAVKSFDGSAAGIGYTVYYYADDMNMADGLKILSIDGVEPNDDMIASEAYPFINPYYAVIAASELSNSPARILYNWLLSPEGQKLVKIEGYVPVNG